MISLVVSLLLAQAPFTAGKTYDLPKPGRFDALAFDSKFHRLLAAHSGANTLAVLDTETGKIQEIETGSINGVAVANKLDRIFVAGGNEKLIALDRKTLKVLDSAPLSGPADIVTMDSKRGRVYVCHDDGTEDWVIDGATLKPVGNVTIEEAPEFVEYDSRTDRVYQNIKSTDHLQVIDAATMKVVATWDTAPMKSPHGLALDPRNGRGSAAGRNGKLVTFDLATGKIVATTDIAAGTDQIGIDARYGRLYCPGGGRLTVVDIRSAQPKVLGEVAIPKGVHTLAVDTTTHDVWLAYGDDNSAHLAQYKSG